MHTQKTSKSYEWQGHACVKLTLIYPILDVTFYFITPEQLKRILTGDCKRAQSNNTKQGRDCSAAHDKITQQRGCHLRSIGTQYIKHGRGSV